MKKIYFFALTSLALAATLFASCSGGIDTKPNLKSEIDSVSYAMGVNMNEQFLRGFFTQSGMVKDTASMKRFYEYQINQANSDSAKTALTKEMNQQMDSTARANNKNIAEFLRGFQEGIKAPDAQDAYINGLAIGRNISSKMLPGFKADMYGEKADEVNLNKGAIVSGVATSVLNMKEIVPNASMYLESKMAAGNKVKEQEAMAREMATQQENEGIRVEQEAISKKFFEDNAKKPGVTTLASGLQYKVITAGTGAKVKESDVVKAHYKGYLLDGTVFESSYDGGEAIEFPVTGVIRGWTEALLLMPIGSKWTVYIPYNLAYGERGSGKIQPYAALIFDIELVGLGTPR